jgi:hypothetical protein
MKKLVLALVLLSTPLFAQTGTPASKLVFDQVAPDLATASGYSYKYYADGATTGTALTGVTCSGTASPFTCQTAYPAFTPGAHTLQLSATNAAGESPKSSVFSFTFVVVPAAPSNIRIGD